MEAEHEGKNKGNRTEHQYEKRAGGLTLWHVRTYCEWLEDILVDKKLEKMKQIYEMPKIDVNKVYQEHMEFIYKSEQSHEYFDFIAHPQKNYTFEDKIKYFLKGTFPGLYKAYKLKRG